MFCSLTHSHILRVGARGITYAWAMYHVVKFSLRNYLLVRTLILCPSHCFFSYHVVAYFVLLAEVFDSSVESTQDDIVEKTGGLVNENKCIGNTDDESDADVDDSDTSTADEHNVGTPRTRAGSYKQTILKQLTKFSSQIDSEDMSDMSTHDLISINVKLNIMIAKINKMLTTANDKSNLHTFSD